MRQNTLITLGASVVCGITAVFLARGWISDAIRTEYRQSLPTLQEVQAAEIATVPVLVADTPLEFGDILQPELLRVVEFPEEAIPAGTFESLNALFIDPNAKTIALRRFEANEVILSHAISGPGARGSLSALVTEGMRAVSVRVDDVSGVAGFVMPGDHVDLIFTRDPVSRRNGSDLISDILLQHVRVLGIDQNLNDASSTPDVVKTVTLEVSHEEAQKLQLAMGTGKLSLTLRAAGDLSVVPNKTIAKANILGKSPNVRREAPRRTAAVKSKPAPRPTVADVTIVRGDERNQVSVLRDDNNAAVTDGSLAGG